ncbi:type II toxin-antitoxin system HicB family antitoxin [Candidatus Microgenomates bacterium]|nr:type II toxin-antitoxin system HicB family antitoxin [Candidatus Microgenomates bacterium]
MKNFHYVIWKEGKWFVARSLEVEVASQGKTEKQAVDNLREALELYLEDEPKKDIAVIEHPKLQSFSLSSNA